MRIPRLPSLTRAQKKKKSQLMSFSLGWLGNCVDSGDVVEPEGTWLPAMVGASLAFCTLSSISVPVWAEAEVTCTVVEVLVVIM